MSSTTRDGELIPDLAVGGDGGGGGGGCGGDEGGVGRAKLGDVYSTTWRTL